jgi:hypothetical protein
LAFRQFKTSDPNYDLNRPRTISGGLNGWNDWNSESFTPAF